MTEPVITGLDFVAFFDQTPDLVCIVSHDGRFLQVNHSVVRTLGYTEGQLIGSVVAQYIHPDDREQTGSRRAKLLGGQALLNFQNRYITKGGEPVWLDWSSIYLPDREVVFAIAKNVTERKKAEQEVEARYERIRHMAEHFKNAMEDERMSLASELHEDLAQLASVIKMDIDWVRQGLQDLPEQSERRLQNAEMVADLLINTIRRMSFSLSPGVLRDLGMIAALEWHCHEFTRLTDIPCTFRSECSESEISANLKMDFFRICQESLNNVLYHANAASVRVHLHRTENEIRLSVTDDGIGFDVNKAAKLSGLVRMTQRADSINGIVQVISQPGLGTTVVLSVRETN